MKQLIYSFILMAVYVFYTGVLYTGVFYSGALAADNAPPDVKMVAADIGSYMADLESSDAFSGTVLFAKDADVIFAGAYGLASKRFRVPNNVQTKLNLGSMNKMFTSLAIMQLVEQGQINLDDPISKYLDESWLLQTISNKIQVQHLLSHSSGLGSYFSELFFNSSKLRYKALDDYKPLVVSDAPEFEPGTGYRYSNTGMFLLGVIIEKASGQDYFDYIRDHIYEPVGMINSDCYEMDQPVPNLAIGYSPSETNETGWENNIYLHVVKGGPAGGCFSTIEDLHRFAVALMNNSLLNADNTEILLSRKPQFHTEPYGFGFRVMGDVGNRIVGHGGGFPGISANLDVFLDQGYVAVVLSNYGGAARPVRDHIRSLVSRLSNAGMPD